jgi:hypothetical protein
MLTDLGVRPAAVVADEHFGPWFAGLAHRLLNEVDLVIAGGRYRLAELEMYYSGGAHADPFAHRDPVQLERGRWYFHRTRGEYRGGSFKGVDIALGDGTAFFGVLVRGAVPLAGGQLDGPCVTVDHVLERTKCASVAALDGAIAARAVWDATSPLHLAPAAEPRAASVCACSRVGLSLKKMAGKPGAPAFIGRPYRFLTEPATIAKGRPHLILALHRTGHAPDAIRALTGVARKTIDRYIADHDAGTRADTFDAYIGKDLSTPELCRMLGTWTARYAR